jgi:hypothetical protein
MKRDTFTSEVWVVELTARYLWGAIRPFVSKHLSKRCARCVLSERYTTLNARGICAECDAYESARPEPKTGQYQRFSAELHELLVASSGKGGGNFDAIVLFSGGKDSAFMLHRLLTEYPKLRLVTMLADNGLMSPYAMANAANALERFDVTHWGIKLKPSFVKKVFHHALTSLDKQRGYSIVDTMDAYLTFDLARVLAARNDIPLVICGLSEVQTQNIFGLTNIWEFPREQEIGPLQDRAGLGWDKVLTDEEMKFWFDGSKWPEDRVPRFLLPYCAWDLKEEFILDEVDRLGLIERRKSRPLMTNNRLIPVIGMAEVARFGYSSFEVEFAQMVREGKSDRGYWLSIFEMLEYSTRTGRFIGKNVQETLQTLGLSKQDIGIHH